MERRQFVGHDGVRLSADVGGDPSRPAVILLHGVGQTRHSWRRAAHALVAEGHHVVALDLRGHGDSDWSATGDYAIGAFTQDLVAVLRQVPPRPALVGASLGGMIAMLTVGESAAPIAGALVMVDIAPKLNQQGADRIKAFMESHPQGFASVEEVADAVATYLPHRPRPKDVSGLRRNLRLGADGRYRWHWDPALNAAHAQQGDQAILLRCETAARGVRIPTLLVRGSASEVVDDEGVRHLLELIPSASYIDVAGATHMVSGDDNDAFSRSVLDFLQANPTG